MRIVTLTIILVISLFNIAHAIPIPALALGYDFFIFIIPFILSTITFVYFYFKKYLKEINLVLLIITFILYIIHYLITQEFFLFSFEISIIIIIGGLLLLFYGNNNKYILNIIILPLIILISLIINANYNIYQYHKIYNYINKNMYSNVDITNVIYKDNFIAIYCLDKQLLKKSYVVIGIGKEEGKLKNNSKYYIYYGGEKLLGQGLAELANNAIN